MGPRVEASLERYGFYPAGGGKLSVTIEPASKLARLELLERGEVKERRGRAIVANLPLRIAERELKIIARKMSWKNEWLRAEAVTNSPGPGNVVMIEIESEHVTEVFTGFGERGVAAEAVADNAVQAARRYLMVEAAAGEYLADQLLAPMAMAGGGVFTAVPPSRHATTNIEIIKKFLELEIVSAPLSNRVWRIEIKS
jgi:RNA 3'-terminal phosphate cyclase (ATP)